PPVAQALRDARPGSAEGCADRVPAAMAGQPHTARGERVPPAVARALHGGEDGARSPWEPHSARAPWGPRRSARGARLAPLQGPTAAPPCPPGAAPAPHAAPAQRPRPLAPERPAAEGAAPPREAALEVARAARLAKAAKVYGNVVVPHAGLLAAGRARPPERPAAVRGGNVPMSCSRLGV
ncbi:unnamed protein product, partial [Prorocentrum cordatum]